MLDPAADPRSPLGDLRARYLPVWADGFDSAFPPVVCSSAWALDALAAPVFDVDASHYGDPAAMAALSVMRYEHQVSRAFADPGVLGQLCIAVASVDPVRAELLAALASALGDRPRRDGGAGFPHEVEVIALSHASALAAACVRPDASAPTLSPSAPEAALPDAASDAESAPRARLRAYRVHLARGIEDDVPDVAYRVMRVTERDAPDCSSLAGWTEQWRREVQGWVSEGQIWFFAGEASSSQAFTAEMLCAQRDRNPRLAGDADGGGAVAAGRAEAARLPEQAMRQAVLNIFR